MALEDILKKISDDAKKQAEAIMANALAEREKIIEDARRIADKKRQEILGNATKEAELEAQRIVTLASLDSRKKILSKRQEVIDECFRKTLNELSSMDGESYEGLLRQILINNIDEGGAELELIISERDKGRIDPKRLVDSVNLELKERGLKTRIRLSPESGDFSGGLLLKRGTAIKNLSWDILFRLKRPEWELELSKILFE